MPSLGRSGGVLADLPAASATGPLPESLSDGPGAPATNRRASYFHSAFYICSRPVSGTIIRHAEHKASGRFVLLVVIATQARFLPLFKLRNQTI